MNGPSMREAILDGGLLVPHHQTDAEWSVIEAALGKALQRPALFLSASVPKDRPRGEHEHEFIPDDVRQDFRSDWDLLPAALMHRSPRNIRRAVSWIAREALARDYLLVFGGHPAISPMVLDIAERVVPSDDEIRVLVFQARIFKNAMTEAAIDLARWRHGCMVLTQPPSGDPADTRQRVPALSRMRAEMTALPNLTAAVFVGGMSGLLEESMRFAERHPGTPRYAVGSTGGAAQFLLERRPDQHSGNRTAGLLTALTSDPSYGALAVRIFDDLG